jgi:transposase
MPGVPGKTEADRIGEEVSGRLEYVPASLVVIEEASQKYACPKGCTVVTAEKPGAPIEKGLPEPGLLAQVAVSKYGDHLPLHRQEEIFRRQGVELSRQTMCDWMRGSADLVSPLYELMKQRVLGSKAVQTDDTPVPVLDPAFPRTRTGRIWTDVGGTSIRTRCTTTRPTGAGTGRMPSSGSSTDFSRPTRTQGTITFTRIPSAGSSRWRVGRTREGNFMKRSRRT